MSSKNSLRFAVIGASRGRSFIASAENLKEEGVQLTAICDSCPEMLKKWEGASGIKLYSDFDQVLNDPEIDAVCIATPLPLHASQSIAALKAGKHVLSEVTAMATLEEGWALIDAVESSGRTYMMAENYCFMEPVLQVQRMVEEGVFGEIIYATGSYIHDCRKLLFTEEGDLTWRGNLRKSGNGNAYPTHSLGPVAHWFGINRTDKLKSLATWESRAVGSAHYAKRNQPDRREYAEPGFWNLPDTTTTSIHTEKGALIDIRVDFASARPHWMARHELQGTKASFCWPDAPGKPEPLIWIEDRSPQASDGTPKEWEPLSKYRDEFIHPLWRDHGAAATKAGHGGGDYFILREFCAAIREGRAPYIDVYDAVTWSSVIALSALSIERGNTPVAVPDFKARCR
jgi:predicted dehydrogenase